MEQKIIKVNCSFCGKEIECPEDMKDSEKHACFECFKSLGKNFSEKDMTSGKIHVDIPEEELTPEMIVDMLVDDEFPEIWKENKAELKELPRRELAERMFAMGAGVMIDSLMQMGKEDVENEAKEKDTGFWEKGCFHETLSSAEANGRMRTFHTKNDEEMNFTCSKCGVKISAHNRDWHGGMCDGCSFEAISGKHQKG